MLKWMSQVERKKKMSSVAAVGERLCYSTLKGRLRGSVLKMHTEEDWCVLLNF